MPLRVEGGRLSFGALIFDSEFLARWSLDRRTSVVDWWWIGGVVVDCENGETGGGGDGGDAVLDGYCGRRVGRCLRMSVRGEAVAEADAERGAGAAVWVLRGDMPQLDADCDGPGELLDVAGHHDAAQAAAPLLPRLRRGGLRGVHSAQLHGAIRRGEGRAHQRHAGRFLCHRRHQGRRGGAVPGHRLVRRHPCARCCQLRRHRNVHIHGP